MAEMLTIDEVLTRLDIGRSTLYRWVEEGKLKPYKAGGRRTYFKQEDVDRLFQPVEDNEADSILEPTVEELQEVALAFQEAVAERTAGTLSTSADIKRMAAEILAARRLNMDQQASA